MIFITSLLSLLLSSSFPLSLSCSRPLFPLSHLSPFSVVGISRDVVDGTGSGTARLRLGRRVDGISRDVVAGKRACAQHVCVWEEEWAVVSRDDVGGKSHGYELTSTESSDNFEIYELPDDNIITV